MTMMMPTTGPAEELSRLGWDIWLVDAGFMLGIWTMHAFYPLIVGVNRHAGVDFCRGGACSHGIALPKTRLAGGYYRRCGDAPYFPNFSL